MKHGWATHISMNMHQASTKYTNALNSILKHSHCHLLDVGTERAKLVGVIVIWRVHLESGYVYTPIQDKGWFLLTLVVIISICI